MSGWSSTELSHYASSSDAEEILDYASDENGNNEKCPICLVSPFTYVTTLCNHQFCLRCIIKMWESENYEIDEDGEWVPLVCPICREVVTILTWTSTDAPIPQEMRNYNSLYRNNPGTRRSAPSRPMWAVSFLVYLLVFIQLTPFLSTRFTIDPKRRNVRKSI
ncbi:unnamed protein product [Oikopleura dioica]|uniref:RING-type domain-containing protein n=1 Tax=Oikopleura dioica TaxID=34765 RepID=E4YLW5_OIKDI|nr:unnamed protein product [Oikopleura dioica]